jgi:hypothetical protein
MTVRSLAGKGAFLLVTLLIAAAKAKNGRHGDPCGGGKGELEGANEHL